MYTPNIHLADATLEAVVQKHETCVHCGMQYVYPLKRKATGIGVSAFPVFGGFVAAERADADSYHQMKKLHAESFDPVRCPGCQGFQPQAIRELRLKRAWITIKVCLAATFFTAVTLLFMAALGVMWLSVTVIGWVLLAELLLTAALAAGWWPLFNPGVGKTYLRGVPPGFDEEVLTLEAHQAMVDARLEARAQEQLEAEANRARTLAAQSEREAKAAARKQRQMQEMAERAKRDVLERGK